MTQQTTLRAFHNDPAIKEKYVNRLKLHAAHDELIHGIYWENGKGCAIGCTLHSDNHEDFETKLGLPVWFARLFEFLFEAQKNGKAKDVPILALEAIPVGANLQKTYHKFCIFLLTEVVKYDKEQYHEVDEAIQEIIKLHEKILTYAKISEGEWSAARLAARSAAESAAWAAARLAARSAAESAARLAELAARSAAESAAWLAESAAWSAAASAAWLAESAESAARSAARSAESAEIEKITDKLIQLLKEAEK